MRGIGSAQARPGNGVRPGLLGPAAAGSAHLGASGARLLRALEQCQRAGACTRPGHGAVGGGGPATEWWRVLNPEDPWTMACTPGNKRWPAEHQSVTSSKEVDLTGGQWCPGEGGRCGGRRGSSARTFEDEEGAAMKKRRWEALSGVAHRGDRFGGRTAMVWASSDG
jgi:hypothetical protein